MTTLTTTASVGLARSGSRRSARPLTRDATAALLWLLLLWVTALWVGGGGLNGVSTLGELFTSVGRITGLISSALLLVQVLMMARVPVLEKAWGQDALTRGHRVIGFTSLTLMLAHVALITVGYAADTSVGVWGTFVDLVLTSPGMLLAAAGTLALLMVMVTSIRRARSRLRYESWHLLHLYAYLGAGLALPHQLWTGADFRSSTAATVTWWGLYAAAVGAVLAFRLMLPLWRSLRAPLRVQEVRDEGHGVTSVLVGGPGVARLNVRAGQFFQWRFLGSPGWTRGHPLSISAAPDGRTLRITAARVGDGTVRLAALSPGQRVLVEGPYGLLHAGVRTRRRVVLMASGIGITPMRGILDELDARPGEVTVIHRTHDRRSAVLAAELREAAQRRGAAYLIVDGPRVPGRSSWLPQQAAHLSDAQALRELVPDIAEVDLFLCGSPGWLAAARRAALDCGLDPTHIHDERFAL